MAKNPVDYFGVAPQGAKDAVILPTARVLASPGMNPKIQWRADGEARSYRIFGAMVAAFVRLAGSPSGLTVAAALAPDVGYRRVDVVYDVQHGHVTLVPSVVYGKLLEAFGGFDASAFASAIASERPRFVPTHGGDAAKAWAAVEATLRAARPKGGGGK